MTLEKTRIAQFWKNGVFLGIRGVRKGGNSGWNVIGNIKKWPPKKHKLHRFEKTLFFLTFPGSAKAPIRVGMLPEICKNEIKQNEIAQFWKNNVFWGILRFQQNANSCWNDTRNIRIKTRWDPTKYTSEDTMSFWTILGSVNSSICAENIKWRTPKMLEKKRNVHSWPNYTISEENKSSTCHFVPQWYETSRRKETQIVLRLYDEWLTVSLREQKTP